MSFDCCKHCRDEGDCLAVPDQHTVPCLDGCNDGVVRIPAPAPDAHLDDVGD